MNEPKQFRVTLLLDGEVVKEAIRPSKYAAKKLARTWEDKNPDMYTEIDVE